jgi:hypothetical protein
MELALSRRGLHSVVASPVAGSNVPNTHTLPRRPSLGVKVARPGRYIHTSPGEGLALTGPSSSRLMTRAPGPAACMPGGWPPFLYEGSIILHPEPTLLLFPDQPLSLEPLPDRRWGHVSPWRSCRRARGHRARGYPRLRGLVLASAITVPRAVSSCWCGRPDLGASAQPARPCRLKRWIQVRTRKADSPTWWAMSGAGSP